MKLYTLILCLFLAACGGTQAFLDPVEVKDAPVTIPTVQPIQTSPVQWHVLKPADMITLAKKNPNTVIFGLDDTNFKNLQLNLADITRYIQQSAAVKQMLTEIITERQNEQTQSQSQVKK